MTNELLIRAIRHLAGVDDGARTEDGQGFSAADTDFGQSLAKAASWSPKQEYWAWVIARKYRGQLESVGIDVSAISRPEAKVLYAEVNGNMISFHNAFKEQDTLKALEARYYNSDKSWRIKVTPRNVSALRGVCKRKDIMTPEIDGLLKSVDAAQKVFQNNAPRGLKPDGIYLLPQPSAKDFFRAAFYVPERLDNDVRGIPGAVWCETNTKTSGGKDNPYFVTDGKDKFWHAPITRNTVAQIKDFSKRHVIPMSQELSDKLRELLDATEKRITNEGNAASDFDVPELHMVMMPFQRTGAKMMTERKKVLNADEMGLGKTLQALATVMSAGAFPVLVIVPAVVKTTWQREVAKALPHLMGWTQVIIGNKPVPIVGKVVIINYQIVRGHLDRLSEVAWGAIIIDEAHNLKSPQAKQTKSIVKLMQRTMPEYRIFLTGTPILNRPEELMQQLIMMDRIEEFGGRAHFFKTYCAKGVDPEILAALSIQLRSTCVIRRKKSEVLTDLPPLRRVTVDWEIDNPIEYSEAEDDIIRWLEDHAAEYDRGFMSEIAELPLDEQARRIIAYNKDSASAAQRAELLVRLTKLRRLAVEGKIAQFKVWLAEFLESGEKLVLFGWHVEVLRDIALEFGGSLIVGDISAKNRQKAIDDFQNKPDSNLIVLGMLSGGVGITLTAGANMAILELPWRPGDVDQAEGRTHRLTQQRACTCYYHIAHGTVDDYMWDIISDKRAIADAALDGVVVEQQDRVMAYAVLARIREKVRQRWAAKAKGIPVVEESGRLTLEYNH